MQSRLRFEVDAELCRRAADELFAMLLRQERAFAERWREHGAVKASLAVLRWLGLGLAIVGVLLSGFELWLGAAYRDFRNVAFLVVLVAFVGFFSFMPQIAERLRAALQRRAEKRCRRRATRMFRTAERMAPYEAEYDVKGDLVVYSRGKDGEWNVAWHRKLGKLRAGLALQGTHLTAIFRRPGSFLPSIILLHRDAGSMDDALREAGLTPIPSR